LAVIKLACGLNRQMREDATRTRLLASGHFAARKRKAFAQFILSSELFSCRTLAVRSMSPGLAIISASMLVADAPTGLHMTPAPGRQLQAGASCTPRDSFVHVGFDMAKLVRSNLGGQGGRCTTAGFCVEQLTASTPQEILFETVGVARTGEPIDMRVTNTSEYRAWNIKLNGIKSQTQGEKTGYFGVVNLLGPRSTNQRGGQWKTEFTHVELKFELLGRWTRTPITLDRTFMTFYDFDTG
jgi:hypothetical protein